MQRRRRVLVADADRCSREFIALALKHAGYRVFVACDGRTALRMTLKMRPDVVVADVVLPMLDGIELAHALHCNERMAQTPVILQRGECENVQIEASAVRAGVGRMLDKPVGLDALLQAVCEAL